MPITTKVLCPVGNFLLGPVLTNTTVTVDDMDIIAGDLQLHGGHFRTSTVSSLPRASSPIRRVVPRPRGGAALYGACGMRKVVYSRYHQQMRGMLGDLRKIATAMALGPPATALRCTRGRGALRRLRGVLDRGTKSCAVSRVWSCV